MDWVGCVWRSGRRSQVGVVQVGLLARTLTEGQARRYIRKKAYLPVPNWTRWILVQCFTAHISFVVCLRAELAEEITRSWKRSHHLSRFQTCSVLNLPACRGSLAFQYLSMWTSELNGIINQTCLNTIPTPHFQIMIWYDHRLQVIHQLHNEGHDLEQRIHWGTEVDIGRPCNWHPVDSSPTPDATKAPSSPSRSWAVPWCVLHHYCELLWKLLVAHKATPTGFLFLYLLTFIVDLYRTTGHILGEGSHGAVHCYEHVKTGVEYAVKVGIFSNYHCDQKAMM